MKKGWEIKKLGDVCEILDNKRKPITKKDRIEGDIPYYGATGVLSYVKDFIFNEQLVLLGEDGAKWEMGDNSAFIISGKTWVNNHAHVLKPLRNILNDNWLVYNLNYQNLMPFVSGMTVPKLNQGNMRKIPIPIPPLEEQKKIVSILDETFEKIEKAKKNVEKNLQNAKELFQSELNSIFSQKGEGWVEKKLGDVCEIKPQKKEARDKLADDDFVTFLPMADLNELDREVQPKTDRKFKDVSGSYTYFANEDVLLAKITPCFENGKLGVARNLTNGIGFGSSEYIVFRSKGNILPDYLFQFLSRDSFREEGKGQMTGAVGHKRVAKTFIENYIIPFPSLEKQKEIVDRLDSLSSDIKQLVAQYSKKLVDLEELKKSILQKAFEGELV